MQEVIEMSDEILSYWDSLRDPFIFPNSCEGDMGSPESPSVWLLGIEPGNPQSDQAYKTNGITFPGEERYSVEFQLGRKWVYNRNAFKFLAVLNHEPVENWEGFARREHIFESDCSGYLKGNVYPEQFRDVETWDSYVAARTGCISKAEYYSRVREASFGAVRQWVQKCRPRLIIGAGIGFASDFLAIVGGTELGERHWWNGGSGTRKGLYFTTSGIVPLAIIPHLSGKGASVLKYDDTGIAYAANYIREAMNW